MTQEEKQLLLKDLCGRLLYNLKVKVNRNGSILTLYAIFEDKSVYLKVDDTALRGWNEKIEDIKPYLRPLSSMTEEEENELVTICVRGGYKYSVFKSYLADDWLNKKGFDYRGLIEKGLAIEAPKDMYKTKN